MVLALAGTDPAASATPPPTIITTRTSILCKALRDVIAPSMFGLQAQDRGIQHGHAILNDLALMSAERGSTWIALDDMRLMDDVDQIAANNIKVQQLLDQLDALDIHDQAELAEVKRLQATLRNVADHQADALNQFSGAVDSEELHELELKKPMDYEHFPEHVIPVARVSKNETLIDASPSGHAAADVGYIRYITNQAELAVAPALQPVIDRCK